MIVLLSLLVYLSIIAFMLTYFRKGEWSDVAYKNLWLEMKKAGGRLK